MGAVILTEVGIIIPQNAPFPMDVTFRPIGKDVRPEQPENILNIGNQQLAR